MPKLLDAAPAFTSYPPILDALIDGAMSLVNCLNAEMRLPEGTERALPPAALCRGFLVLSAIIRRTILVSRYLETVPRTAEECAGQVLPVLDLVLAVFGKHKMDMETYNAMIDAELEGDDEADDDGLGETERVMAREVEGRRPCILVAELCRDFGLVTPTLPAYWLDGIMPELRFLCARAAAAAIGPNSHTAHTARVGHLMER